MVFVEGTLVHLNSSNNVYWMVLVLLSKIQFGIITTTTAWFKCFQWYSNKEIQMLTMIYNATTWYCWCKLYHIRSLTCKMEYSYKIEDLMH